MNKFFYQHIMPRFPQRLRIYCYRVALMNCVNALIQDAVQEWDTSPLWRYATSHKFALDMIEADRVVAERKANAPA